MLSNLTSDKPPISVAVIGIGGLGIPVLWGLLQHYRKSVANKLTFAPHGSLALHLIEPDLVERSNLNRQILFTEDDLGRPKVEAAIDNARKLFCLGDDVALRPSQERVSLGNIATLLANADLVIEATDSVETKLLVNDYCVAHGIPFVYGGVTGNEGLALRVTPQNNQQSACLRCLFGNFSDADHRALSATCRRAGIFGPVAGHLGFLQASLAIECLENIATGVSPSPSRLLRFSFNTLDTRSNTVEPDRDCPLGCSEKKALLLDLQGEICPKTFLFTKLVLEKIVPEEVLDVRYDSLESAESVHESVYEEGYTSLSEPRQLNAGVWQLLIKKAARSKGLSNA